jgi:hypothetical protein
LKAVAMGNTEVCSSRKVLEFYHVLLNFELPKQVTAHVNGIYGIANNFRVRKV